MPTSEIFHRRREVAERMVPQCDENGRTLRDRIESAIVRAFRCQAGVLHLQHGLDPTNPDRQRNKEYAPTFEQVTLFPGRMATMAGMKDLTGTPRPDKPWLDGLPRMIKVGDMGDLMSSRVPFEYLRDEVVLTAISPKGRRHLWLWATRRPVRMAEFARWLRKEGLAWPRNLIPMASILDDHEPKGVSRLMEIKAVVRGLVIKDDVSNRRINFKGFRWVVIDCGTHTGNTHWLKSVASQCRHAGCALFIQHPDVTPWNEGRLWGLDDGTTDGLIEFTGDFRVREIPGEFRLFQGTGETSHEDFNARLAEFHANEQPRLASLSKRVSVERLAEFNRCDAILREFSGQMKKAGMD